MLKQRGYFTMILVIREVFRRFIMESVIGGMLIGIAVSAMLFFNGRVTGISGIIGEVIKKDSGDNYWRILFITGLFLGGLSLRFLKPSAFHFDAEASSVDFIIAGLLVGFGTQMGKGCTSGHGVCGISRLSVRSIVATVIFMVTAVVVVFVRGHL
jgi:uncharacterized membrane protein YedE/YeeE